MQSAAEPGRKGKGCWRVRTNCWTVPEAGPCCEPPGAKHMQGKDSWHCLGFLPAVPDMLRPPLCCRLCCRAAMWYSCSAERAGRLLSVGPSCSHICLDMLHPRLLQTLWLNHAVTTLWPYYNKAVAKLVLEQAKTQIDEAIKPVGMCLSFSACRTLFISWLPSLRESSIELFQGSFSRAQLLEQIALSCNITMPNCMCPSIMLSHAAGTAICRHASPHVGDLPKNACLARSTPLLSQALSMLLYL